MRKGGKNVRGYVALHELPDAEFNAALEEIDSGSDRVAAIMGCALVENTLIGLIIASLKDSDDAIKLFDAVRGPLSTFHAKIVAAKAFGIIDPKTAEHIHTVRQVRNDFAHGLINMTFHHKLVSGRCEKLKALAPREYDQLKEVSEQRRYYEAACFELTTLLIKKGNEAINKRTDELKRSLMVDALSAHTNAQLFSLGGLAGFINVIPPGIESGE